MGRMRRLLLCLALLTGCRSWEVRAFDIPLNRKPQYFAGAELTSEEKWGVAVILAVAIGGAVAIALAVD
jgi:hypothetical protein